MAMVAMMTTMAMMAMMWIHDDRKKKERKTEKLERVIRVPPHDMLGIQWTHPRTLYNNGGDPHARFRPTSEFINRPIFSGPGRIRPECR